MLLTLALILICFALVPFAARGAFLLAVVAGGYFAVQAVIEWFGRLVH